MYADNSKFNSNLKRKKSDDETSMEEKNQKKKQKISNSVQDLEQMDIEDRAIHIQEEEEEESLLDKR